MAAIGKTKKLGNREKLLRAALVCLRDKGYARTTARDLVAESSTNLASIGYHFGSKEALLHEALAKSFRAWSAEIERATFGSEADSAEERLERSLTTMLDRLEEIEPFLASFVEAFPPAVRSTPLRNRMAEVYEELRVSGANMIQRAVEADGMELSREHAETISSLMMALFDGMILQYLLDPGRVPSSRQVMEALGAALTALGGTLAGRFSTAPSRSP